MSFRNLKLKGDKWCNRGPKTPEEEFVAKPETLLLIIFSFVYKSDIEEVHGN